MRKLTAILVALSALLLLASCSPKVGTLVDVTGGRIEGYEEDGLKVFKGIPFAEAPVGDLRWKAPQRVIDWEGVRSAKEFGPSPIQGGENPDNSEDCLYLNVWTPATSTDDRLPVMVWIYGGGFAGGSSSYFDGAPIAKRDVLLVSINYRVGVMGFFAHPELSAENDQHVSGNYGILDQIAGLKWVQDNIASFGGDPNNVTIFGESAGGISVSMLCASPLAKGLFARAISQSGGSFGPVSKNPYPGENMIALSQAESEGLARGEQLGAQSIADLRAMAPTSLGGGFRMAGGSWPVVDGYVIPDCQYTMYSEGNFNDVDVLIGYNSDEGLSFGATKDPAVLEASTKARYEIFADTLMKAYPIGETTVPKTGRDLTRDAAFGWQTWTWARLQAQQSQNSRVYLYYFDQHPDYPEGSPRYGFGSPHGQDVDFVFGSLRSENASEDNLALSEQMMSYWTNFAKTGDPNGEGLPEWRRFTPEDHCSMLLTSKGSVCGPVPSEDAMTVLDGYFAWRRGE